MPRKSTTIDTIFLTNMTNNVADPSLNETAKNLPGFLRFFVHRFK